MGEIVNPYIAGAPVTEQRMFFGREDVFSWIENSLSGQYADHILVVHGQRRVGKTSVLKQLGNRLPKRYIPVFFDLQGRTHTTLDRFLWWLAREIVRVLKQERGIDVPVPEKETFTADPEYFENKFLTGLRPILGENSLLLTFDEFDNLEESEVKEELARPLVDYLRRMMGEAGLNFIFSIGSSGRKLENMQASYTEFFKTALYKKISFLSRDQTTHLITKPVEGVLEFEHLAVEMIFETTFGHPYFTQLMCHELFARCQRTEQRRLVISDVEAILDDVVERGTVNLKFVWDDASDIEKWSLAALAHMEGKSDNRTLADYLRKNRVRFSETDLNSGLLHLREKDVLTAENRFVIGLLRLWLQKNRSIEQAREELTEVNPIANRYIEIGLEFKDSQLYEKAIESFQEALAIAKDNIQAQVNIALVYMDQKAFDKAVVEFEKALVMDDEDVSARAGLCEAHLALGDSALGRGRTKEAVLSYQRVLGINAEHTEARQRMAEISHQRAEKALTDGKDEEALSAFAEALKFTPEDESLARRFEEAKKERQEKVLSTLLARAEKELTAKNWDSAVGILQEGLQLSKEDERFKTKIATAKEKQRAARLESILARASQAEQTGRWETAIAALEESLSFEAGQPQVQERLERARVKFREAQLRELRERARSLARSERWDEALATWDEFLVQEPADESARSERKTVEKRRALAQSYAEAQKALAKKNYDKAITLFKGIVMEDADYKDASRQLAQAIELRRTARKWWQSKWIWGSAVGLIVLAIGWFAFRPGSSLMRALFAPTAAPITTSVPSTSTPNVSPATPTTAIPATVTPTSLPFTWARLNSAQFVARDTIHAIAINPSDPGVIYIGTLHAGVFKSIDGGISWQPAQNGMGGASIDTLVIDPQQPDTLYAGVYNGGLYKTSDGGKNWVSYGPKFVDTGGVDSIIVIDPTDHQHLYYAPNTLEYESQDGGKTWLKFNQNHQICPKQISALLLDPEDQSLYANEFPSHEGECTAGGVYQSDDHGRTWTLLGLQGIDSISGLFMGKDSRGDKLLIAISHRHVYFSTDHGKSWNSQAISCNTIAVDPQTPTTLYCGSNSGLYISTNGGSSWADSPPAWSGSVTAISVLAGEASRLVVGGTEVGISTDQGASWINHDSGLGGNQVDLTLDPSNASIFYLTYIESNCDLLYRSIDTGRTWNLLPTKGNICGLTFGPEGTEIFSQHFHSTDQGADWYTLSLPSGCEQVYANPFAPGALIASCLDGDSNTFTFFYSNDFGKTWQTSNMGGESGRMNMVRLFFGGSTGQRVYAIFGPDLRSDNGGKSWQDCGYKNAISSDFSDSRLIIDPRDPDHILRTSKGEGVLISTDGCRTWTQSNAGLGSLWVNTLARDPKNVNTIYAGTDGGAYISTDGGETWGEINDGLLGATVVYSIVVDKDSNVYAATPYGIFKLEGK